MLTRRTPLLGALFCTLPGLLLPRPSQAQHGDDGEYQILHARYGTAEHNVDVTERLRQLARQDRRFRMGNDSFGIDPHPNQVKVLRIYARGRDGQPRTFEFAEGAWVDGDQFTGWAGGRWGQSGWKGGWNSGWNGGGHGGRGDGRPGDDGEYLILQARYGTAERDVDVTDRLRQLARQDLRLRVGNDTLGVDPHPQQLKQLRIHARGRDGQIRSFDYAEGAWLDGSRFRGWSGGQWGEAQPPARKALRILSASYGAGRQQHDISQRLRAQVQRDRLEVRVDNELAGLDPVPGTLKWLRVSYSVGGGRTLTQRVREGDRLSLP